MAEIVTAIISGGVALVTALGTAIFWGARLEGEVKVQKQRVDDLKELINEKFEANDARLERIERKLDVANGKH